VAVESPSRKAGDTTLQAVIDAEEVLSVFRSWLLPGMITLCSHWLLLIITFWTWVSFGFFWSRRIVKSAP
jgi:hypothetical protein